MIEDIIYEKLKQKQNIQLSASLPKHTEEMERKRDDPQLWLEELDHYLHDMEKNRQNYAFRYIYSCRKVFGKTIVFFKRAVRKLLKWYIEPICNQQTEFNNSVTPAIGRLTQFCHLLYETTEQTRNLHNSLQQDILCTKEENRLLKDNIESIYSEINKIKETLESKTNELGLMRAELENKAEDLNLMRTELENKTDDLNLIRVELENKTDESNLMKAMLEKRTDEINLMRADINRIREIDASLFDQTNESFFDKHTTSQSGEDSIIAYIFFSLGYSYEKISYLDLGANHAREMSNTYFFYEKRAKGVLVEANPDLIPELKLTRHRDIILNRCISNSNNEWVDFYILNGDGVSSCNLKSVEHAITINANLKIVKTVQIQTISVNYILEKYFTSAPEILNIDIEGGEMDILTAWDFSKYRPVVIVAETIPYEANIVVDKKNMELISFLQGKGYVEYAFTGINSIFIDREKLNGGSQA